MFTPFAFIKRQVTTAIAAIGQRILLLGNFTTFNTITGKNGIKLINGTSQIDPTFNVGDGANNTVITSDFDVNGKLILGGAFTSYSGSTVNRIVRANSNGTIDNSFNIGVGPNSSISLVKTLTSGKTLIAGDFTTYSGSQASKITRLNSNGTLDATFAEVPIPNGSISSLSIQTDNKILVGGSFGGYGNGSLYLAKINSTGNLDTTFIDELGTTPGPNNSVLSIAAQSDGKLIIGGTFTNYLGNFRGKMARINTNGTLDTTFAGIGGSQFDNTVNTVITLPQTQSLVGGAFSAHSGVFSPFIARLGSTGYIDATFTHPNLNGQVYSIVTQSDGKIIAGGVFTNSGVFEPRIAKLNSQLDPDTTFNQGSGTDTPVFAFASQSDGKILIGGQFTTYSGSTAPRILKTNTNGTIDTSFNPGVGFNSQVEVIRVQPDDKILVGGLFTSYSGSASQNHIIRLNSNGTKDTTFNLGAGFSNGTVHDMQLQSDGKIIVVGTFSGTYSGSAGALRAVRLNTNGSRDLTFNIGTTGFSGTQYSAQIQNDGKIIVVGASSTYSGSAAQRIRRINTNGTLDTTFNIGTTGLNSPTYRAKIQPDQKILVAGSFTSYSGSAINRIVRINPDGTRDLSFDPGAGLSAFAQIPSALELDSSGNIYAGSDFLTYSGSTANRFVKISPSGSIVTGSGLYTGFSGIVNSILVGNAGSLYTGGGFSYLIKPTNRIVRLNTNGIIDPTFNIGSGFSDTVYSLAVQADDKIVVGGAVATYSGSAAARIRRLNTDGTNDTSFNQGTGFATTAVLRVKIQPDQKILAIGDFSSYSGSSSPRIIRLNADGTKDFTFNPGTGFNTITAVPSALELDSSGNIYVGSNFTTYSGSAANRFVKLSPSGSIITGSDYYNGYDNTVHALSVDSTQSVYAGGLFTSYPFLYNGLLRLNENGTRDSTFNTGIGAGDVASIISLPSNKVLIAGGFTTYSGSTANRIAKLNTDGTIDTSFNPGSGFNTGTVSKVVVDSTGRIIARGSFSQYDSSPSDTIVRIEANGTKDGSYNPIGLKVDYGTTHRMMLDDSDSLHTLTSKYGTNYNIYKKFNSNGILDNDSIYITSNDTGATSFSKDSSNNVFVLGKPFSAAKNTNAGIIAFNNSSNSTSSLFNAGTGFFNTPYGVMSSYPLKSLKTTSGDIWIATQTPNYYTSIYYSGSAIFGTALGSTKSLFKINQQGNLINTSSYVDGSDIVSFAEQPDGKLLIGLNSGGVKSAVYRLNSDGSYDNTFQPPYLWYGVCSIQVQSTGKVLIGGDFNSNIVVEVIDGEGGFYFQDEPTSPYYFLRLNSNGTVDGTFALNRTDGVVYNINTLPDDSSIITGNFTLYSNENTSCIAKINSEGIRDTSYNSGYGFDGPFSGVVYKTALQSDGKLIAAGEFSSYSGSTANKIARINADGTLDTTFNPGSGFNTFNSLNSKILVDDLGNIHVAGGGFTSYSGSAISGYIKILPNGNIDPTGTSGSFAINQPVTMELLD